MGAPEEEKEGLLLTWGKVSVKCTYHGERKSAKMCAGEIRHRSAERCQCEDRHRMHRTARRNTLESPALSLSPLPPFPCSLLHSLSAAAMLRLRPLRCFPIGAAFHSFTRIAPVRFGLGAEARGAQITLEERREERCRGPGGRGRISRREIAGSQHRLSGIESQQWGSAQMHSQVQHWEGACIVW